MTTQKEVKPLPVLETPARFNMSEHPTSPTAFSGLFKKENKYLRDYPYKTIDIYRVLEVYEVQDPCIQHAVKKLLCAGQRGYKEIEVDIKEALQSLERWVVMCEEDKKVEELKQRVLDCYK